jgi:hypothetical protein
VIPDKSNYLSNVDECLGGDNASSKNHARRHGRYLLSMLKLLIRLRNMKLFTLLALAAPAVASNQLKGE